MAEQTKRPLNICIISRKNLKQNTRITRQARALRDAGHHVHVIATEEPDEAVMAQSENITYHKLPLAGANTPFLKHAIALKNKAQSIKKKAQVTLSLARQKYGVPATLAFCMLIGSIIAIPLLPLFLTFYILSIFMLSISYMVSYLQTPNKGSFKMPISYIFTLKFHEILRHALSPYLPEIYHVIMGRFCKKIAQKHNFDIIQAHDSSTLVAAYAVHKAYPNSRFVFDAVEVFKELSSKKFADKPTWIRNYCYKRDVRIMHKADRIITFGPGAAQFYADEYQMAKPDLIRNCRYLFTPTEPDTRIRKDCNLSSDDKLVVILNTLYQGQGLEQVIEAMSYLDKNIHICTVGWDVEGGAYLDGCLALAQDGNVTDRLHFLGRRTTEDLIPYASGGDIGLMPRQHHNNLNNFYSMPNRIFELIMARLPIAATSLNCIKHLINATGAGMVMDQTDPKDIAKTITQMLKPETLKELKQKTEQTARLLSWENEGRSYVDIMENIGNGNLEFKQYFYCDAHEQEANFLLQTIPQLGTPIASSDKNAVLFQKQKKTA